MISCADLVTSKLKCFQEDALDLVRELYGFFYQQENTDELEIASPNDRFSYSPLFSSPTLMAWTIEKDNKLLSTAEMVDRASNAFFETIRGLKWEQVTKVIHMGNTSDGLEDAYKNRHKQLKEEDELFSTLPPKAKTETLDAKLPKYERTQSVSSGGTFRLSKAETPSRMFSKKRSASSERSSPEVKRIKTKKEPESSSYARDIGSIPAYSAPSSSATLFNSATPRSSRVSFSDLIQSDKPKSGVGSQHRSFSELRAEAHTLGREAQYDFDKFERDREQLGENKLKVYKFRSRFPSQAARIDQYTHFDLEHMVKKAGLHKYSRLNKAEMLETYLGYLYDKYKLRGSGDLDRELAGLNPSGIEKSYGW